jgi:predicted DNA-binding ribbon-helix-helix protein
MDSFNATTNFLQILDNAVNDNLEKIAENKGITVQELITVFQKSG